MNNFYNGNKLLSMKDLRGEQPDIYMCCGNRTAGKTFFFKRWMLRRFAKYNEKFVLFVRFIDDIANAADGFFADIGPISFPHHTMGQRPLLNGKAAELLFDDKPCGYVIALNDPERIKRNSSLFADAQRGFLDEFMSEVGKYVPKEIEKFNSIRISIGRGGKEGKHVRRFPIYLCSNNVTIFNPYFEYFGVCERIDNRTKYLRGNKWVLEQTFNEEASNAIIKAYSGTIDDKLIEYAAKNVYLLDNRKFIYKLSGQKYPLLTLLYNGKSYGLWGDKDKYYISEKTSDGFPTTLSFNIDDHDEKDILAARGKYSKVLRAAYEAGELYFENMKCKHAFFGMMSIK